jgi:hypothetical protein
MRLDKLVLTLVAAAPPIIGLAVSHGWLTAGDATATGAVLTALVIGYITPADEARAALTAVKSITPSPTVTVPTTPVLSSGMPESL